jgi:hypothetical protein
VLSTSGAGRCTETLSGTLGQYQFSPGQNVTAFKADICQWLARHNFILQTNTGAAVRFGVTNWNAPGILFARCYDATNRILVIVPPRPEPDGSYIIGAFRPNGGEPLPIAVKLVPAEPAQPSATHSPFPKGAHIGGPTGTVLVCHDDVDVIYALFYYGEFASNMRLEHNTRSRSWQDDGTIKLGDNGRTFGYQRLQSDSENLRINGQEFDLRQGRVLELRDDGAVEQLNMFPSLSVATNLVKLAALVTSTRESTAEPVTAEKLRVQLENAEARLTDLLMTYAPAHPLVIQARQSVEELKKKIAGAQADSHPSSP